MSYLQVPGADGPQSAPFIETTDEESLGSARDLGHQEVPGAAGKVQLRLPRVALGACLLAVGVFVCTQINTPGLRQTRADALNTISMSEMTSLAKGKCKKSAVALKKVLDLESQLEATGRATSEDKTAASDIISGKGSEEVLHEIESVISHSSLADASATGTVITEDDMNSLVDCETGATDVHLEEDPNAIEGDMLAEPGEGRRLLEERILAGAKWAGKLWENGEIKYCYEQNVKSEAKRAFVDSVKHVMGQIPCLHFKEIARKDDTSCVEFPSIILHSPDKKLCNSYVGCVGWGHKSQAVNLGNGCESMGTSAHELGHALGMTHEQSRADREKSIVIHYDHIRKGKEKNFRERDDAYVGSAYDILSLMHYGSHSFSVDGHRTIETTNQEFANLIGQRMGFSQLDVEQIGRMYGCEKTVKPLTMNKELSLSLAEKSKTVHGPYTKAGCLCKPDWDECATSKNGYCCTPKSDTSKGNFCKTMDKCDVAGTWKDWDFCTPREAIVEEPWYIKYPKNYVILPVQGAFVATQEFIVEHVPTR